MHKKYNFTEVEKKWQKKWQEDDLYRTDGDSPKEKVYVLDMFPYPSGEGLHVGHPKGYIATDVYSRMKTMQGFEVLHPMGWDAFGLPAENFAIKNKIHPRVAVEKNIENFKAQLAHLGFNYDWSREINTTDPAYYKWTQWIFLKLLERGLAYESYEPINWCPSCQTGLANEDLESDGTCERCGSVVEKRPMRQWVLKITEYADRMLQDLDTLVKWPEHIKEAQRNWIGKKEGTLFDFETSTEDAVRVFTTRPDTLFGATYVVLAPEHDFVAKHREKIVNWPEVEAYVRASGERGEIERTKADKEKTGVRLEGIAAKNPATGEDVHVFIADYVLPGYGTGAIMAVPAHDERDFAFAQKFGLPVVQVVSGETPLPFTEAGTLVNSGSFNGKDSEGAKQEITERFGGTRTSTYRLNDWVFSRQRYWGEPIPVIHCEACGVVPVPLAELPVVLPEVEHYEPTGTGESPLANIAEWVNVPCPTCGKPAKRETNTMPQWAGSSWYYLRFIDPQNDTALVDEAKEKKWAPVDVYVGGDHAVRHLIYARFWHKFLYDIGVVHTIEPFERLEFLGFILAGDGRKMSKRWGNIINPDDIVKQNGADTLRVYEMFMGPFENTIAWSTDSLVGAQRFLERVSGLKEHVGEATPETTKLLHKTIAKVGGDIEAFKFNTAVSQLMIFINQAEKTGLSESDYRTFLLLIAPFAPHLAEELWSLLGETTSIHRTPWPVAEEALLVEETVTVSVQVNGKMRGTVKVAFDADERTVLETVQADPVLGSRVAGEPKRVIYVKNKILNLVL